MAAVTLSGKGTIASAGRISGPRLTLRLAGKGTNATGGTLATGLVSLLSAHATTIANRLAAGSTTELSDSLKREWREELSEAGFGSFVLMNDNGLTASVDWLPNQLVDFHIGSRLAYTILVEQYEAVDIDERGEEQDQNTTYKGRGHVSLLDRIVIYPALGPYKRPIEEDRAFNWTNPAYDDTAWIAAHLVTTILFGKVAWDSAVPEVQWDADFPDDTAEILWASDGTVATAGIGDCYFRQTISISTDGSYTLFAGADNYGEVYVDGVLMLSPGQSDDLEVGFTRTSRITIDMTAGTHYIACKCTNGPGTGSNPAGIAWALYPSDALGNIGTLAAHSSAADSVMVEYATEPPGMTPGQAIILCLDEALEREADALWQAVRDNLTFTDLNDSNGDPWPTFADMATKVGTGLFTFLRELAGTYIDFSMSPGTFALNAWTYGNRSSGGAASFHSPTSPTDETTGNLLRLKRTGEA